MPNPVLPSSSKICTVSRAKEELSRNDRTSEAPTCTSASRAVGPKKARAVSAEPIGIPSSANRCHRMPTRRHRIERWSRSRTPCRPSVAALTKKAGSAGPTTAPTGVKDADRRAEEHWHQRGPQPGVGHDEIEVTGGRRMSDASPVARNPGCDVVCDSAAVACTIGSRRPAALGREGKAQRGTLATRTGVWMRSTVPT